MLYHYIKLVILILFFIGGQMSKIKNLTSRERALKALNHEEPDRVPIDMGSTLVTGIMAHALDRLRKYLKLDYKPVKVYEVFQMLGEVEQEVIERFDIDFLPVEPLVQFFGLERRNYKSWKLWDDTEVLMPEKFNVEIDARGNWLLHSGGNNSKPVEGVMPKNGYYFDRPSIVEYKADFKPPLLEEIKKEKHLTNIELEFMAERAENLRKKTDKALVLDQFEIIGLPWVGSIPNFLMLLCSEKNYVKDLFKIRTETAIKNLEKLKNFLGDNIDVIVLDGTDIAGQDKEFFNPKLYEEIFVPFLKIQNDWIHKNTNWKTFQHICGSLVNILPLLLETNLDIISPVQLSAKGMDPVWLKNTFGKKIVFWGAGIDTQKTLPFGNKNEIIQEVKERIKIFGPGGGFVFNTIHNIQQGTPPENIVAVFDTVRNFGQYPVGIDNK
jgi:uroporphyrinogen-III decarboxylase